MKNWVVYYAIRYKDGNIEDRQTDFKALTIREALEMAERFTAELAEKDKRIDEVRIWEISIVEMNPF